MSSPDRKPDFTRVSGGASSTEPLAGSGETPPPLEGDDRRPDFSRVRSGASSTEPLSGDREYTVVRGDTLSDIAQAHYGKASRWRLIFEANRDRIDDPDLIHPGQVLRIPSLERHGDH